MTFGNRKLSRACFCRMHPEHRRGPRGVLLKMISREMKFSLTSVRTSLVSGPGAEYPRPEKFANVPYVPDHATGLKLFRGKKTRRKGIIEEIHFSFCGLGKSEYRNFNNKNKARSEEKKNLRRSKRFT